MPLRPIDEIVTGYEDCFDFPEFTGEPKRYLLATVPRSGSTWFSHMLWRTGCLGAPLEYLNFEPTGPFGRAHTSQTAQEDLWKRVVRTRTSPNGVFGLKAFPAQLEDLGRLNPALLAKAMRFFLAGRSASRVVQLRRRDSTAHAISLARASLSGVWRKEQEREGGEEPAYSSEMVARAERDIVVQESAWDAMYRDLGITPLVLWYEDALENEERSLAAVADYLDVDLAGCPAPTIPRVERQSQAGAQRWRAAHDSEGAGD